MKGIVTLVVGPSGVGKSSYYQQFYAGLALEKRPRVFRWTTRDPREGNNFKNYSLEQAIDDASELIDVNGNLVSLQSALDTRDRDGIFKSYFGGGFVTDDYYEQHKEELVAHHDYQKSKYGFNLEEIIEHLDKGEHVLEQFVQYEYVDELSNALTERGYKVEKVLIIDDLIGITKKLKARSGEEVFKQRKDLNIDNIKKYLQNLDDFDDIIFNEVHKIGKEGIKRYIDELIISIKNDEEIKLEYDFYKNELSKVLNYFWDKKISKELLLKCLNKFKDGNHLNSLVRKYPLVKLSDEDIKLISKNVNFDNYNIYKKIASLSVLSENLGLNKVSKKISFEIYSSIKDIQNHKIPKGIIGNHIYKNFYLKLSNNLIVIENEENMLDSILRNQFMMSQFKQFISVIPNLSISNLRNTFKNLIDIFSINNSYARGTFIIGLNEVLNLSVMNFDYLLKSKHISTNINQNSFVNYFFIKNVQAEYQNNSNLIKPNFNLDLLKAKYNNVLKKLKNNSDFNFNQILESVYFSNIMFTSLFLANSSLILHGDNTNIIYNPNDHVILPSIEGLTDDMGAFSHVFNDGFSEELKPFFVYQNHFYLKNLNRILFADKSKPRSMDNPWRYPFVESPAQLVNDYWIDEFRPLEDYVDEYLGDLFKLNKFLGEYVKKHEKLQKPYEKFKEALDKFVDEC